MVRVGIKRLEQGRNHAGREAGTNLGIFAVFFFAGILAGSFIGAFPVTADVAVDIEGYFSDASQHRDFALLLWNCSKYHLLALAFGTSLLGTFLIPALAAFRGYLISLTVSAIVTGYGEKGFLLALVSIGIPSAITIPCFFVLAQDSISASRRLISASRGIPCPVLLPQTIKHIAVCALFLTVAAAVELLLIPALIQWIIA